MQQLFIIKISANYNKSFIKHLRIYCRLPQLKRNHGVILEKKHYRFLFQPYHQCL